MILYIFILCRFDFDKFISAIQDVKQGVMERLRQWAEYEAQLEKLVNWLGDSESALKNYCHKSSMEEKLEQVERFKVRFRVSQIIFIAFSLVFNNAA